MNDSDFQDVPFVELVFEVDANVENSPYRISSCLQAQLNTSSPVNIMSIDIYQRIFEYDSLPDYFSQNPNNLLDIKNYRIITKAQHWK